MVNQVLPQVNHFSFKTVILSVNKHGCHLFLWFWHLDGYLILRETLLIN